MIINHMEYARTEVKWSDLSGEVKDETSYSYNTYTNAYSIHIYAHVGMHADTHKYIHVCMHTNIHLSFTKK